MLDFVGANPKVAALRATTQEMVGQEHFPDDNNLLAYLRTAGYLADETLVGYLPAALYSISREPGAVELMIDGPKEERALTVCGGPMSGYSSPHQVFKGVVVPGKSLQVDSGHVVELTGGSRHFIPKHFGEISGKLGGKHIARYAVDEEWQRLGLGRTMLSTEFVSDEFSEVYGLSFTGAIREAAKWASYTLRRPIDNITRTEFGETLTIEDALQCLGVALQCYRDKRQQNDGIIIREIVPGITPGMPRPVPHPPLS